MEELKRCPFCILCPKCISAFNKFMQEGKTIDPREG